MQPFIAQNGQVRCLFCRRLEEQAVVRSIQEQQLGVALFPQKKEAFCRRGQWFDVLKPLLPGYVFVYSEKAYSVQRLLQIQGVLRCLTYGPEQPDGYLIGSDRRFALWLFQNEGIAGPLQAIREGSFVRITDGLLKEYNGRVEKVNQQKRMAYLSMEMANIPFHLWMSFQYLEEKNERKAAQYGIVSP